MLRLGHCLMLLSSIISIGLGRAQLVNLVPNPGFEEHTSCDQLVDNRAYHYHLPPHGSTLPRRLRG